MGHLSDFDVVFGSEPDVAYAQKAIDQIVKRRRQLENELFVDKLLKVVGGPGATKLYPPRSNQDLRALFGYILEGLSVEHYKDSLIYYLLKDLKIRDREAGRFANTVYLPRRYQIFIDGIWCLDRLELEKAVDCLTEPCLIPTYPEEILYTLCRNSKDDHSLALAYFHTVTPTIRSSKVRDAVFDTICHGSITEAFYFSRREDEFTQRHLFERMISFVHGSSGGEMRAARAVELVGLPFSQTEEDWYQDFLTNGKGKSMYGAKDAMVMRSITAGRVRDAVELGKTTKGRKIDGLNWEDLVMGL